MGSKYPWKPLNDGVGPGVYDLPVPGIKGGYIEPEGARMYSLQDINPVQQNASPTRNRTMANAMEA
jgi:hypothetical protein